MKKIILICLSILILPQLAGAALNLKLTKGIKALIPIAVLPFAKPTPQSMTDVSAVINQDLSYSGQFSVSNNADFNQFPIILSNVNFDYWQNYNLNALVIGSVVAQGGNQYQVNFTLVNLFKNKISDASEQTSVNSSNNSATNTIASPTTTANNSPESNPANSAILLQQSFVVKQSDLRQVGHKIANLIYQQLTEQPGYFTSKIAYVAVKRNLNINPSYSLMVADYDGYDTKPLIISNEPIATPAWSPQGDQLAYISYENKGLPALYTININSMQRHLVGSFTGSLEGTPAWSPDGSKLAIALSKHGSTVIDLASLQGHLTPLISSWGINTEPSWLKTGDALVFTSNRNGTPQLYQLDIASQEVKQLTYNGNYNTTGSYSPLGDKIVLVHGDGANYNIGLLDLTLQQFTVITNSNVANSPSFSPNCNVILYSTLMSGHEELIITSLDGLTSLILPNLGNSDKVQPTWSPV